MLMRKLWVTLLMSALLVPVVVQAEEEARWKAGKHYQVLPYPVRTRDPNKVEVVELFWYGCPHCYSFNPLVLHWEEKLPEDVDFWLSPAVFGRNWQAHAQAFYTAEALGMGKQMHQPLFDAIVRDRKRLDTEDSLAKFFAQYGVQEADFRGAFNSFSVKTKVDQAIARGKNYRATGVPALIVNGKYRISATDAGGQREMLEVADFLIAKERAAGADN